jgi:hypothetical protein
MNGRMAESSKKGGKMGKRMDGRPRPLNGKTIITKKRMGGKPKPGKTDGRKTVKAE